jgi:hypothetical protein
MKTPEQQAKNTAWKKAEYQRDPQKFRDRANARYVSKKTPEQLAKRAEYMRRYNAEHPDRKAESDKKYRLKYLDKLRQYDRWRNLDPATKAAKLEDSRRRRAADPEKFKRYSKEYYQANKEKWAERSKLRTARPAEVKRLDHRKWSLSHKYKMTVEQYDAMLATQNGVCAICGEPSTVGFNKRLHVDHDHTTGKVRGLLCMHCNHSIERVEKIPGWAAKTEAYLARPR